MASIYRRGKVWWVKFHLKGIRVQQSLNTTHERVAQARKSQIEYRLATGTLVIPSETPVGDFLEGFCQYLRGTRTRKSPAVEAGGPLRSVGRHEQRTTKPSVGGASLSRRVPQIDVARVCHLEDCRLDSSDCIYRASRTLGGSTGLDLTPGQLW